MSTSKEELAMFNLNMKHCNLSVEIPQPEKTKIIKFKLYVDGSERTKGSLSKRDDKNIWYLDSDVSVLANKDSEIRLVLLKRHRVRKHEIASFRFTSADLLSRPLSYDYEEVKKSYVKDGITLTITLGESELEPVNAIAQRLLEGRNSLTEKLKKYQNCVDTLKDIANTVAQSNSFASVAVGLVSKIWEKCKNVLDLDDALIELLKDIIDLLPDLVTIGENARLPTLKETLAEMEKEINEAVVFIDKFRTTSFAANAVSGTRIDDGKKIIKEINRLRDKLLMRMGVQQFHQIGEAAKKKLLETLNPVSGADTNHQHKPCLEGTRAAIIEVMKSWVFKDDTTMFWLNGLPGVGKSTIACSVIGSLNRSGVPTVSFFFQRNNDKYNDATRVVQTMIYYLACLVPNFGDHLLKNLDARGLDSSMFAHYSEKLKDIVHDALTATQWDGRAVLLVDALDECANQREQAILAKGLLEMTQRCNWLKVMVTSRPYKDIERFFTAVEQKRVREISYKMSDTDPSNSFGDLVKYTEHCFKLSLENERDKVEKLARRANGLFQWVTVASQFIEDSANKKAALNILLDQKSNANADSMEQLYILYQAVITECLNLKLKANASAYTAFLTTLIALKTPLHAEAMSALVDILDPDTIEEICKSLRSVINVEESGLIVIAHQSFADYVFTATEHNLLPPQLRIDPAVANASLASKCLDVMLSGLKFNICALETSTRFNKDIPDLQDRISTCIPAQLQYACLHWLEHYSAAQSPSLNEAKLTKLLSTEKMLFWLEVLSLTGKVEVGMHIQHLKGSQEVKALAREVHNFVKAFIVPMARSTPHLYVSALPFVPRQSPIFSMARARFGHLVAVTTGYDTDWRFTTLVLQCQAFVYAVAFSPDGRWVVSGSKDGKIRMWDVVTGTPVGEPLEGHSSDVYSVAFSPDGTKIVSGSYDKTIRVWDAGVETVQISDDQHGLTSWSIAGSSTTHPFRKSCRALEADGWMYLEDEKSPLLWVPTDLRHGVRSGTLLCIGGRRSDERVVILDFSHSIYGENWTIIFK